MTLSMGFRRIIAIAVTAGSVWRATAAEGLAGTRTDLDPKPTRLKDVALYEAFRPQRCVLVAGSAARSPHGVLCDTRKARSSQQQAMEAGSESEAVAGVVGLGAGTDPAPFETHGRQEVFRGRFTDDAESGRFLSPRCGSGAMGDRSASSQTPVGGHRGA